MELKEVLPQVFEKIGFDYKKLYEENIKVYTDIDYGYERVFEKTGLFFGMYYDYDIEPIHEYPTILTSSEFIDCLSEYIKKAYSKDGLINYVLLPERLVLKCAINKYLINNIGFHIYNNSIADWLYNLIKD